ncbi:hypothetical protein ES332_A05G230300v1 [Gossypium tomentosum]|uniref:J domain-containing protein n=1 Tax=Gossypium tomentosum TaxID=34277 RepID=A0A5D2QIM2_GOSTO|nr:hypothetical protein ES332_A05G230300v1 [Gossypium tomentosum]
MGGEDADSDKSKQWSSPNRAYKGKEEDPKLWGLFLFGLIGATATTFAVSQLRRSVDWMFAQLARSQSSQRGGSFRTSFQEEAWRRYNRRLQEEYEEEMERVYRRSYESWRENGPGAYNQHYQRDDWYWKAEAQFRDQRTNFRQPQRDSSSCPLSHHYSVLGLDRSRTQPYTEDEIKAAFRAKAKQFHPDQNQKNKEVAEAKFKEVMTSYEAIKQERKNMRA